MQNCNELHEVLHTLWTKAVGTVDYNKTEWLRLETLVEQQRRKLRETLEQLITLQKTSGSHRPL
jgi:hypothetical protein